MPRRLTRREWCAAMSMAAAVSAVSLRAQAKRGSWTYLHYDVFTEQPLTGNQLAVFPAPEGLTAEDMARITREMNFAECTFIFPAEQAGSHARVRIFGLDGEMPFAGHPTIGSTFALADLGRIAPPSRQIVLGLGAGPTPIDLEWNETRLHRAWMQQQRPEFGPTLDRRDRIATALGIEPTAIREGLPVQQVSCGLPFFFVPLASRAAVDQCSLDIGASTAIFRDAGVTRRGIYVFSTEATTDGATVYGRNLAAGREDAATGAAAGPLGSYLVRYGLVGPEVAAAMISRQGVKMRRPSTLYVRIRGTAARIDDVTVGGAAVLVGEGRITQI